MHQAKANGQGQGQGGGQTRNDVVPHKIDPDDAAIVILPPKGGRGVGR